jgi:hypothetical protein
MSGIPFPVSGQDGQPLKVRIVMRNQKTIQGRLFVKNLPVILSVYITDQDSIAIPTKIIQQITLEKETDKVTNRITYFNNTFVGILTGRTNSQSSYRSMVTV